MAKSSPAGVLFSFRLVPVLSAMLARRGVDAGALLTAAGLPLDGLRGEFIAPLPRIRRFLDDVAARLEAPHLGLDLAERVPTGAYGIIEFLVRAAPTVHDGLRALCQFGPLVNPSGEFRLLDGPAGSARLHYAVAGQRDVLGSHLNEYSIAFLLRQFALVFEAPLRATEVWFAHGRRTDAEVVARRLGVSVRFHAADCGFALPASELARAPRTADPPLFEFARAQAQAQMARVGDADIITQASRVIAIRLGHGEVSAEAIASAMSLTTRTLQRHLTEAGTTFRDVLTHVRRRRQGELRQAGLDEGRVAAELGFSDARAMRRSLADE